MMEGKVACLLTFLSLTFYCSNLKIVLYVVMNSVNGSPFVIELLGYIIDSYHIIVFLCNLSSSNISHKCIFMLQLNFIYRKIQ